MNKEVNVRDYTDIVGELTGHVRENHIQIALASSSRLFLEGLRKVLEDKANIKITAEASNLREVEKCLTGIKPNLLWLFEGKSDYICPQQD